MGDKFRLIGNAVPPFLAEKLALAIKRQVFDMPAQSVYVNQAEMSVTA
jgi:hypothetical protein